MFGLVIKYYSITLGKYLVKNSTTKLIVICRLLMMKANLRIWRLRYQLWLKIHLNHQVNNKITLLYKTRMLIYLYLILGIPGLPEIVDYDEKSVKLKWETPGTYTILHFMLTIEALSLTYNCKPFITYSQRWRSTYYWLRN